MSGHSAKKNQRFGGVTLILAVTSLLACGDDFSVEEIYIRPPLPVEVGGTAKLGVRVRYPPEEVSYRWRSQNGLCEPQESRELHTIYTALRPGMDRVQLEVLKSGVVIRNEDIAVKVIPSNPEAPPEHHEPQPFKPSGTGASSIRITQIPPYDTGDGGTKQSPIAGVVASSTPGQRVVLYACTNACYVQPLIAAPFTEIQQDGTWSNWTHTGEVYMALLVERNFEPQPTVPGPQTSIPGVVSRTTVDGLRTSSP
jgi:hypothetical protein